MKNKYDTFFHKEIDGKFYFKSKPKMYLGYILALLMFVVATLLAMLNLAILVLRNVFEWLSNAFNKLTGWGSIGELYREYLEISKLVKIQFVKIFISKDVKLAEDVENDK